MISITSQLISNISLETIQVKQTCEHELFFLNILPPNIANETSLVFISDIKQFEIAKINSVKGFIIKDELWTEIQNLAQNDLTFKDLCIWTTNNIQKAMSSMLPMFDLKKQFLKPGIHPSATIHPSASVDSTAHIGAQCVIEAHSIIGAHTIIYPQVYIGHYCKIGNHCIIAPQTTIGSDGFGYVSDKNYQHTKIPQIGNVIIEDHCEIGSHCAIDRATLTSTLIKKGTKIDNHCHIAHNVEIGENGMITAGFIVAGSTKIGRNFTTAGGVHVTGHIQITDNVVLSGRAGATNHITAPGMYGGFPLESHRESVKTLISIPQIKKIKKQVNKILKHLHLDANENS